MSTSALEGRGSGIAPENLHEVLSAATNAGDKGSSAWWTPLEFAKLCAIPLPNTRVQIADLTAGCGNLVIGSANEGTRFGYLLDVENCRTAKNELLDFHPIRIAGDITKVYPLLKEVDWVTDLFCLNPPWSVHWHRSNLADLATSELELVRRSFDGRDSLSGKDQIDSTAATLMIALDRCSRGGEGYMICNHSTVNRLLFAKDAPHEPMKMHVWARIVLDGNPMTAKKEKTFDRDEAFKTEVLYFARDHTFGHGFRRDAKDLAEFKVAATELKNIRSWFREGAQIRSESGADRGSQERWRGVKEEYNRITGQLRGAAQYNIYLAGGKIQTYLSLFKQHTPKIPQVDAENLFKLNGKTPMELVVARESRDLLLKTIKGTIWSVDPKLPELIEQCIREYHSVRSPMYPLNAIMSLSHLEEEDYIECRANLYEKDLKIPLANEAVD